MARALGNQRQHDQAQFAVVEHALAAAAAAAMTEGAAAAPAAKAVPAAQLVRSARMEVMAARMGVKVMSHESILFRYIGYPIEERYIEIQSDTTKASH
jgi:hypothetical protein